MRNIKVLGLLVVSAMALVAFVGTSAASATAFTSAGAGNALFTSLVTNHVFSLESNKFECEELSFSGETEGASTTQLIVTPAYKKCKMFGFNSPTISINGCKYELKAATDGAGMGTWRLFDCEDATEGLQMDVNVPGIARCLVDIPEQSLASAVAYSNPTATEMRVTTTLEGIMVDVTIDTGLCPLKGTGTRTIGVYTGASDFSAAGGMQFSP